MPSYIFVAAISEHSRSQLPINPLLTGIQILSAHSRWNNFAMTPAHLFISFPESSLQPDSDIKGSSSDDGHTPYELTPDEIDVVIGPATATVTSSSTRDSWPWRESAIVWTDPGVSSKVVDFPDGFPITAKTRVFHIELVNGIPSQFPIPEELTAFIVCADTLDAEDKRKTIDAILKDYVCTLNSFFWI